MIDFGSVKALNGMDIKWEQCAYKYKIETSNAGNDNDFQMVIDKTTNTVFGDTSDNSTANAWYVRVIVTGCSNPLGMGFCL